MRRPFRKVDRGPTVDRVWTDWRKWRRSLLGPVDRALFVRTYKESELQLFSYTSECARSSGPIGPSQHPRRFSGPSKYPNIGSSRSTSIIDDVASHIGALLGKQRSDASSESNISAIKVLDHRGALRVIRPRFSCMFFEPALVHFLSGGVR